MTAHNMSPDQHRETALIADDVRLVMRSPVSPDLSINVTDFVRGLGAELVALQAATLKSLDPTATVLDWPAHNDGSESNR